MQASRDLDICICYKVNGLSFGELAPLPPPLSLEHFICKICRKRLDQPVELSCSYTLCGDCPVQQVNAANCQCHITSCRSKFTVGGIKKPSEQLMASLGALQYKCTNGSCTTTVPLQRLQNTSQSACAQEHLASFQKPTHRLALHYRKS